MAAVGTLIAVHFLFMPLLREPEITLESSQSSREPARISMMKVLPIWLALAAYHSPGALASCISQDLEVNGKKTGPSRGFWLREDLSYI